MICNPAVDFSDTVVQVICVIGAVDDLAVLRRVRRTGIDLIVKGINGTASLPNADAAMAAIYAAYRERRDAIMAPGIAKAHADCDFVARMCGWAA